MNDDISSLAAAFVALALAGAAQAGPADPTGAAPAPAYESAFSDYKPWQDIQPGDWRAMNDALRTPSGGHGGQAAAPAAPAPSSAPVPPSRPADGQQAPAAGHGAHPMHGGTP